MNNLSYNNMNTAATIIYLIWLHCVIVYTSTLYHVSDLVTGQGDGICRIYETSFKVAPGDFSSAICQIVTRCWSSRSSQCSTTGFTQVIVCVILSVG